MSNEHEDSKSNEPEETRLLLGNQNSKDEHATDAEKKVDVKETLSSLDNEKKQINYSRWTSCLHVFVYISFGGSVLAAFASAFFYMITSDSILEFMSFAIIIVTTWFGSVVGIIATWKGTTLHQIKFKLQALNKDLKQLIARRQTSVNELNRTSLQFAQTNDQLRVNWIDLKNENNKYKNQNEEFEQANKELKKVTQGLDDTLSFCPLIKQQLSEQQGSMDEMHKVVSIFEEIKKYYNKIYLLDIYYKYRTSREGDAKTMNIEEWAEFIQELQKHSEKDAELRKIYYKWNPDALDLFIKQNSEKEDFKYYDFDKNDLEFIEKDGYMEASKFTKNYPKSTRVFQCIAKNCKDNEQKQSEEYNEASYVKVEEKESDDNTISIKEFEKEVEAIFKDKKVCFWSTVHGSNESAVRRKKSRRRGKTIS